MSVAQAPGVALHTPAAIATAVAAVRARTAFAPEVAVILGTGLGGLASAMRVEAEIAYDDLPGFPLSTVESHHGRLLLGTLGARRVVAMQGRFHRYEGYSLQQVTFPVRVLHALGAGTLIVSNACGGMHPLWAPGDLMLIADHINLLGDNPLIGPNDAVLGPRFPDMSAPYSPRLAALLDTVARDAGVALQRGVYAGLLGPTYETPAEIRMLDRMGADAVGMSTVPEVVVARALGMEVAGISLITNPAAGISPAPLDHAEVVEVGRQASQAFCGLVERFVASL